MQVDLHAVLEDLRVDGSDAVDGVRADDAEVSHVDSFLAVLLDQRHAAQPVHVTGELLLDLLQEQVVDVVDDLHVPGKDVLQHGARPALKRLRQHRVVCVGARALGDVPGLVPRQTLHVHKDAHQLGHRQRGMRVVQLDGHLVGQRV
jgi:hypothetical protein